jgi:hypothetical protein
VHEGEWPFQRFVVVEFPSREAAEAWYRSPAYQKILPLRLKSCTGNLVIWSCPAHEDGLSSGAPSPAGGRTRS